MKYVNDMMTTLFSRPNFYNIDISNTQDIEKINCFLAKDFMRIRVTKPIVEWVNNIKFTVISKIMLWIQIFLNFCNV